MSFLSSHQESISSTFFEHLFLYKSLFSSYILALIKLSYKKRARKTLMKFTLRVIYILCRHTAANKEMSELYIESRNCNSLETWKESWRFFFLQGYSQPPLSIHPCILSFILQLKLCLRFFTSFFKSVFIMCKNKKEFEIIVTWNLSKLILSLYFLICITNTRVYS